MIAKVSWLTLAALVLASTLPSSAEDMGPVRLVADLAQDSQTVRARPVGGDIAVAESQVFLMANDPIRGSEIWRTDGSEAGTYVLTDLCPGPCSSRPRLIGTIQDRLIFTVGKDLWVSDGTEAGTRFVIEFPGLNPFAARGASVGNRFLLLGDSTQPIWSTDGTAEGTVPLLVSDQEVVGNGPSRLTLVGDQIFFWTRSSASGEYALWSTDGTVEGTQVIESACETCSSSPIGTAVLGDQYLFLLRSGAEEISVWVSDGTEIGTRFVKRLEQVRESFSAIVFEDRFYSTVLQANGEYSIMVSDGTEAGTRLAPELLPPVPIQFSRGLYKAGSTLYFLLDTEAPELSQLWTIQGPNGRQKLAEGELIFVRKPGRHALFFSISEGSVSTNWTTLGAPETTRRHPLRAQSIVTFGDRVLLSSIIDAPENAPLWIQPGNLEEEAQPLLMTIEDTGSNPDYLTSWNGRLAVRTRTSERLVSYEGGDLWLVDGSEAQRAIEKHVGLIHEAGDLLYAVDEEIEGLTVLDRDLNISSIDFGNQPSGMANLGDVLFVGGLNDQQLWITKGTQGTTELVAEIQPGWRPCSPCPASPTPNFRFDRITPFADRVLFGAFEDSDGPGQLWISDGTPAGTRAIQSFPSTAFSSAVVPSELIELDSSVYFKAPGVDSRNQLWVTEGDLGTTRSLTAFETGALYQLNRWNASVIFVRSTVDDVELWQITAADSEPNRLLGLGAGFFVSEVVSSEGLIYIVGSAQSGGPELWVSDGTQAGTHLLALNSGRRSSFARNLTAIPGGIFFGADDGSGFGHEPWISAGTAKTTRRLGDVFPGPKSSSPGPATLHDGTLYFAATAPEIDRELFAVDLEGLTFDRCPAENLCLMEERFRVSLEWQSENDTGTALRVAATEESGLFHFFDPDNWESMVKVLDGCAINGHFWVFAASSTNLGYTLTVEDLQTGMTRNYTNPLGMAAKAIHDTEAFSGCSP